MHRLRTLLALIAISAVFATGCEWHFETLDGDQNGPTGSVDANVGTYNTAVLYNGLPHVFYYDQSGGNLRHAYYNGFAWVFETLDGAGGPNGRINADVGTDGAAVLYNGRPHVFYRDETNDDLRHGYYNGSAWVFETLDGAGGSAGRTTRSVGVFNAVTLYNGRPHVFYYDSTTVDLRHGYWNGQFWAFETLDGAGGSNGRINAGVGWYNAVVIYNGRPHVFHHNVDAGTLRHAYYNGQFWAFETLDGNGGANGRTTNTVGRYNSVLLYNGRPHVFYRDASMGHLRHGYWNGQIWAFEVLDGAGGANGRTDHNVGAFNATVLQNGRPRVFYWNVSDDSLRHAYYTGAAWGFETLDGNGGPGGRTTDLVGTYSAVVLYQNQPHVFYWTETNRDLRHGYFG